MFFYGAMLELALPICHPPGGLYRTPVRKTAGAFAALWKHDMARCTRIGSAEKVARQAAQTTRADTCAVSALLMTYGGSWPAPVQNE
jgi:hypothetical protein